MKKKLFSNIFASVLSIFMVFGIASATFEKADAALPAAMDLCLDGTGAVRTGVRIGAFYQPLEGDAETLALSTAGDAYHSWEDVLTSTDYTGNWKGIHIWKSVSSGYKESYIQLDLGKNYFISEIGFKPFADTDSNTYWGEEMHIYVSDNPNFETYKEVTAGKTAFPIGEITTCQSNDLESMNYRYIRFAKDHKYVGASKIIVKGYEEIEARDLLHDSTGAILDSVKLTASSDTFTGEEGKYSDIAKIADGIYTYQNKDGSENLDLATSCIVGFNKKSTEWIQVDLGDIAALDTVSVLPFVGNQINPQDDWYFRRALRVMASNDPNFTSYAVLCEAPDNVDYGRGKWLEFFSSDLHEKYRYIRIEQTVGTGSACVGVTELEIKGYVICESFVTYTNIDSSVLEFNEDGTEDTTKIKKRVSNISNANQQINENIKPDYHVINDRLQIHFNGAVNPQSVSADTLKIQYEYKTFDGATTNTAVLEYTPAIADDTVYIDLYQVKPGALVTINVTGAVQVNGMYVNPQVIQFRTGDIAPIAYKPGFVIRNAALGKSADVTLKDGTPVANMMANNGWIFNNTEPDIAFVGDAVFDLGNVYKIEAVGISSNYSWHPTRTILYAGLEKDSLDQHPIVDHSKPEEAGKFYDDAYGYAQEARQTINAVEARYIKVNPVDNLSIKEVSAYTYAPVQAENGIIDAYYTYDASGVQFKVETDGVVAPAVFTGCYKDGKLLNVMLGGKSGAVFESEISKEAVGEAGQIMSFVWEGASTMKPQTRSFVF